MSIRHLPGSTWMNEGETADVRFSDARITNQNDLLRIDQLVFSPRRSYAYPRTRTLNKKSKELLRSPIVAAVKGKCAASCHHHLALSTDCLCLFYSLALESDRHLTLPCSTSSSFPAPTKDTPACCEFAGRPALGQFETQNPSSNWSSSGAYVHGHGHGTLSG